MPESIFNLKIFRWINKEVVEKIIMQAEEKKFSEGEMIMIEGENSNGEWYIIKNWSVSISIWWKHIAQLSHWDIFWEIALLNEEERTATVTANEDVEVIILTLDSLIEMINNDENTINKEIMRRIEENISNS